MQFDDSDYSPTTTHNVSDHYQCEQCQTSFTRKSNLTRHLRIHQGNRRFSCDECGKKFTENHHLIAHSRTHSGQKPFSCPVCHHRFSDRSNCSRHVIIHGMGDLDVIINKRSDHDSKTRRINKKNTIITKQNKKKRNRSPSDDRAVISSSSSSRFPQRMRKQNSKMQDFELNYHSHSESEDDVDDTVMSHYPGCPCIDCCRDFVHKHAFKRRSKQQQQHCDSQDIESIHSSQVNDDESISTSTHSPRLNLFDLLNVVSQEKQLITQSPLSSPVPLSI